MVERRVDVAQQRWNYEFRDPNASTEALIRLEVPKIEVPRKCLYGIQTIEEYEVKKRRRIERHYNGLTQEDKMKLLHENPTHAVAIPFSPYNETLWSELVEDQMYHLALLDGHHRSRYVRGVTRIPTLVMTVDEAVEVYYKRYHLQAEGLVSQIVREMNEALSSFVRVKESLVPCPVYVFAHDGHKEVGLALPSGRRTKITSARRIE